MKVDPFRCHEFGGKNQVALVLAVFFIDQNDHATGADVFDDFLDG